MLGTHQEGTECERGVLRRVFVLPEKAPVVSPTSHLTLGPGPGNRR